MSDFDEFIQQRIEASNAFLEGNVEPLREVSATSEPASIFGPSGTVVSGVDAVNEGNAAGASHFGGYDRNDFQTTSAGHDGAVGWWTGTQRSLVRVEGQEELITFDLRVTELFRLESGEWKLFHRHADPLKEQ